MKSILQMRSITKSFSGIEVLHSVDFNLAKGEVHALMGENGAGKSTLMKILMGEFKADAGQIILDNKQVDITSPAKALNVGIAMIHQELNPIPNMTIAENIYLGREPKRFGVVLQREQENEALKQLRSLGLSFNPTIKMKDLNVSETQMIEIAKTISYGSRIIIMDEPTSAITETEVEKLFEVISLLKSKGVSIIYISHKIDEVFKIADRVTVLRDGYLTGTGEISDMTSQTLIKMMVGREISKVFPKSYNRFDEVVLSVRGLTRYREFEDISFDLHKGEVLGIAGLMGAGRTEIATTIFGERKPDKGEVIIKGHRVRIKHPKDAVKHKIAFVPEDRKLHGLNLVGTVLDNVMMVIQKNVSFAGVINNRANIETCKSMITSLSIKTTSVNQQVSSLSGGNQQKVVLAKWLLSKPDIIVMDEPTRGIDVGAKSEIYKLINDLVKKGKSIIMISSEIPELIGMCDRVIVLHEGHVTGELKRDELSQEKIMTLASIPREVL